MIKPPEYSALINPIACNAYAMRYDGRKDTVQTLVIDTGEKYDGCPLTTVIVCDYITQSMVCDALLYMTPFVRLMTPVKPDYAAQFMMTHLAVEIDGERVIKDEQVERYLIIPPFRLPEVVEGKHAGNDILVLAGKEEEDLLGGCRLHFLPNGTRIQIRLTGIPTGSGKIRITSGALLGNYTTKPKQGCLFEVGELDAQQQAYPSPYGWTETRGKTLSQSKIEAAYSSELKYLLEVKAKELEAERNRRMEIEDQVLKDKAAARADRTGGPEKPPATPMPSKGSPDLSGKFESESCSPFKMKGDLDNAMSRAKRRLIVWGIIAFMTFAGAALVSKVVLSDLESFHRMIQKK